MIDLPVEVAANLCVALKDFGVKPEYFVLARWQEKLAKADAEFVEAMQDILKKNTELCQRLA